ncbi:hypothetical protein TWF730_010994 [Orbilia blumenaviensis]|uniref:F-box domain-containing protein n=1 Tax=Orbilia blumenaviensis TaxID=1796055 RepID=A0AAV9UMK7_9PEZI
MSKSQDTAYLFLLERVPNEIKTIILELLDFSDIKSLRLVSKALSPICNVILFRRMRLLLSYGQYPPPIPDPDIWPPLPAKPSFTIRKYEAFASFRQRDIFRDVQSLEILSYTPDAVRGCDGDVAIKHRMGVFVSTCNFQGYAREFHTEASVNELVDAMNSMTRLTSLYMHTDFLEYLEHGQLSLDFLASRVKSFKIVSKFNDGILPSTGFFLYLVTLEAHPVLLSKAKENGLVNLPNLKSLVVYGGRAKDSRRLLSSHAAPPPEAPLFNLNEFLAAQESPFTLVSLSLKTLGQTFLQQMITSPGEINSALITPYLSNLRRLYIDFDYINYSNMNSDHIWDVFRVNKVHLEDIRLMHISKQLISYLRSYRDTLKSVQIEVQASHPLGGFFKPARAMWQELGTIFWRDVIPAHSSTLHTLRAKPRHNRNYGYRELMQKGQLECYLPDSWSLANNPTAQEAIERCERLRDLAVFSIDNEDRPFEQVIWLMIKQPKLRRFTFYHDYCTEWEYPDGRTSNVFHSAARRLLQDALGWKGSEDVGILGGFRVRNPLEIELYPAGKLKTYFDWNRIAWMLVQVELDRKEPKDGERELDLDEGLIERVERLGSLRAFGHSVCVDNWSN